MSDDQLLKEIHGEGDCHICHKPKSGPGSEYCSYPHGMVPDKPVMMPDTPSMAHSAVFWTWILPDKPKEG